jgi:hypothetical protein
MPIQVKEENSGKLLTIHVSGKLEKADYEHFVPKFRQLVRQYGKLRILFDMTDFHGWESTAMWEDIRSGINHFIYIERLAMVGEKKWQQGMAIFCKPFTKATIRYFDRAGTAEARNWMAETNCLWPLSI